MFCDILKNSSLAGFQHIFADEYRFIASIPIGGDTVGLNWWCPVIFLFATYTLFEHIISARIKSYLRDIAYEAQTAYMIYPRTMYLGYHCYLL